MERPCARGILLHMQSNPRRRFYCVGTCQLPLISDGSVVEIDEESSQKVTSGDLVVFINGKAHSCHRILFQKWDDGIKWFFIKPDNSLLVDGWIPSYRILGRVTKINRDSLDDPQLQRLSRRIYYLSKIQYVLYQSLTQNPLIRIFNRQAKQKRLGWFTRSFLKMTSPALFTS